MSNASMTKITILIGVLAVATSFPAWYRTPAHEGGAADLSGKPLVRGDKEIVPEQIVDLAVVTWDDSLGKANQFQVKKTSDRWIIPSKFNYPADGGSRVGNTAGGFLNVPHGPLVSRDTKQHQDLGVLDPLPKSGHPVEKTGIGKRITMKDATGAVAVDLIIGKAVTNGEGMYYIRDADSNDVYAAKVNEDISTTFTDWVETGLLKFSTDDVRSIMVNDYFIDEAKGSVTTRAETAFERKDSASDWTSLQTVAGKQVAKDAVNKIITEATSLKLQGVRPYDNRWLMQRGFFFSNDKQLYGNEGRIVITNKDGLRWILFFGEIALGDDDDSDIDAAKKHKEAAKDKTDAAGHNRYVAVFVQYDEKVDEAAIKAAAEKAEKKDDKKDAEAKNEDKPKQTPQQIGAEKAKKAQAKFGSYFYVVSNDNFKNLKPAVDTLFEATPAPKPEEKPVDASAAGAPAPVAAPSH